MRMFLAGVETISRSGLQVRRAAFDRTGVIEYGAAEIRPDQFVCVAQGIDVAPAGTVDLGLTVEATLGSLPTARKNQIATRLGITRAEFEALTVGELLLLFMAGTWVPHRDGKVRIGLGGVTLLERDAIQGGAITDAFTYSNGRLSTVSSGVWTDSSASMAVSSNAILWSAGNSSGDAFHTTELASADHYVQFTAQVGTGDYRGYGGIVRGNGNATAGSATGYRAEFGCWNDGGVDHQVAITRLDGGTTTEVASANVGAEDTDVHTVLVTAEGTTVEITVDSVVEATYGSASSYTTQKFVGIYAGFFGGSASMVLDAFEADVLGGTDGTATPAAISMAVALPAASAGQGATASPAATSLAVALPAPTPAAGAVPTPAALAVAVALPAPTPSGSLPDPVVTQVKSAAVTATRSPAFTLDTSPLENDVIYVWVSSTTAAAITDTSGWTNVLGANTDVESDSHEMLCVYHRVTAAEDTANTVTWTLTNIYDATETGAITAVVVRNVDPADALAGANSTFDSANTVTPAVLALVTPDATGGLVLSGVVQDSTGTYTEPAGWTVQSTFNTNQALSVFSNNTLTTSGVQVGPTNVTPDAGDEYISITVVAKKAVSPNATVNPSALSVAVALPAAGAKAGAVVSPAATSVAVALPAATPAAGAVPTPDAINVAVALPAPTVAAGATPTPAATAIAITLPQATAGTSATAEPDAIPVTVAVPQATPAAGSTAAPAAIPVGVTIAQATPSGAGDATATPAAIPVAVALPAPTPAAGATVTPAAIIVTLTLPAATATAASAGTGTPDAIAVTLTIPQAEARAGSTVTPAATTVTVTLPQATPQASSTVAPDPIALEFTLPTVTLAAGAVVTPDVIQLAVAMPAVVVSTGATVTPAAIQVAVELGAVIAFAGAMVIIFSAPTIWKPPGATLWQPPSATTWKPPTPTTWTP